MARIALTAAGYLGDLGPYLAIARRAVEAGHEAVVIAPEGFRFATEGEPFDFVPYALDCSHRAMHADPVHRELMEHPNRNILKLSKYWVTKSLIDDPDAAVASLQAAFQEVDVLVTHPGFAAVTVPIAQSMGIPVVVGHLFPMTMTEGKNPPPDSPFLALPDRLGRLGWSIASRVAGRATGDREINRMRAKLGRPPLVAALAHTWKEAERTVVLGDPGFFGLDPADRPGVRWGGFTVWKPRGALDPDLLAFLREGPPPVLVTLGTAAATQSDRFRTVAEGLDTVGLRSVVLTGSTVDVGSLADRPGVVPFAPIHEVLPHCSAAVVSGALGGVGATLAAGIPQVVHPHLIDQVVNGRRVEALALGRLVHEVDDVAAAAATIVGDPGYAARARDFARGLGDRDGATAVLEAVDDLVAVRRVTE